jgi:AraC-type DNA-binding domain-containing proteins
MGQAITYLYLIIGLMMFVFSALLATSRRKTRVSLWLGAYVFSVGYIWAYYGLYRSRGITDCSWLLCSDILMQCIAGPSLFFYTKSLTRQERPRDSTLRLVSFLPAFLALCFLLIARPGQALPEGIPRNSDPTYFWSPGLDALNTASDGLFFVYAIASTVLLLRWYARSDKRQRGVAKGILAYYLVGLLTAFGFILGHAYHDDLALGLAVLVNGLNTSYLFFWSHRWPEYTQREVYMTASDGSAPAAQSGSDSDSNPTSGPTSTTSSSGQRAPKGIDVEAVLDELERVVKGKGEYRDPDLSLQTLSTMLGLQHHQLSQILNKRLGTNFRGYINHYRLEEAKRLLVVAPDMSILDIAYAVGFNSKSAFNALFVKATGFSPSAFRKNNARKV